MQFMKLGDCYAVRLDRGEEIVAGVTAFAADRRIDVGEVSSGLGSACAVVIGHFARDAREYSRRDIAGDMEIVSLAGNLSLRNGRPCPHLQIVVAGPDGTTRGGHLLEATVAVSCELIVRPLPGYVQRSLDPATGWYRLEV